MRKFERIPRRLKIYILSNRPMSPCHVRLARRWMRQSLRLGAGQ